VIFAVMKVHFCSGLWCSAVLW